uniref:MLO-like protein n=1 Tax=Prunus persica TaxID=3760 RepID=D2K8P0_PRUPE|nr:powdery mildew resistance locus O protein [Prunus persica]
MAASESSSQSRELDRTPTWAVSGVCAVIIIISLVLEKVLHKVGTFLTDRHKRALFEALEKVKAELMILGFISLLLTFGQSYIARICIPLKIADTMLPCTVKDVKDEEDDSTSHRRLLWNDRRSLAAASDYKCKTGYEPLYQLMDCTMILRDSDLPTRHHLLEHIPVSGLGFHSSFMLDASFRQFFRSVSKSDYLAVRNGFITVHLGAGSKFNFQKYIKRSLEDDFKVVVGVSPVLWASFVIFLLLNVKGWQALFWASLIPLIIILLVGTKLQAILTKMALEITERHAVVQGIPLVQALIIFWFARPQLVLHFIHFALFQNAFPNYIFLLDMVFIGVEILLPCQFQARNRKSIFRGWGSMFVQLHYTSTVCPCNSDGFTHEEIHLYEQTSKALKKWHMAVKKKHGGTHGGKSPTQTLGGGSSTLSTVHSSGGHTLHRFKTTGHSTRSSVFDDHETSDLETDPLSPTSTTNLIVRVDQMEQETEKIEPQDNEQTNNPDDFSFAKPAPDKET